VAVLTEAKRPQVFRDEGAFDRRAYLAQQNIDLVATLRAAKLIERIGLPSPTIGTLLAKARNDCAMKLTSYLRALRRSRACCGQCFWVTGVCRPGGSGGFQKTGVFSRARCGRLHVGALAFALYWVGRKLRLSRVGTMLFTLTILGAYVAVV